MTSNEAALLTGPPRWPAACRQAPWQLPQPARKPSPVWAASRAATAAAAVSRAAGGGAVRPARDNVNLGLVLAFLGFAVSNRVFNRMLLVPLRQHTYFLAQATGLAQTVAFAALLIRRTRRGLVTSDMLKFVESNKWTIVAIGVSEGVFLPTVFFAAARLPGALVQVLNQSVVPFTVAFGAALLGRRYRRRQVLGIAVVFAAIVLAAAPTSGTASTMGAIGSGAAIKDVVQCVVAYALLALGVTLKDAMFARYRTSGVEFDGEAAEKRNPQDLDVCVVCTPAAIVQMVTLLLSWPVLASCGTPGVGGWSSAVQGASVLSGLAGGVAAPLLAVAYWTCNVAFSVCTLELVRRASAATVVLANVAALPLSALIFCLPLPLLHRQAFHWNLAVSLILAVIGNLIYGSAAMARKR